MSRSSLSAHSFLTDSADFFSPAVFFYVSHAIHFPSARTPCPDPDGYLQIQETKQMKLSLFFFFFFAIPLTSPSPPTCTHLSVSSPVPDGDDAFPASRQH